MDQASVGTFEFSFRTAATILDRWGGMGKRTRLPVSSGIHTGKSTCPCHPLITDGCHGAQQIYPRHWGPLAGSSSFGSIRVLAFIISSHVTDLPSYAAVRPRMQVIVLLALSCALLRYLPDAML